MLVELEAEKPTIAPKDLLVKVKGVSMNPVDYKVREWFDPATQRILGWDAAGIVEEVGPDVKSFKVGDEVFYAGEFTRDGSNAEYQAVDERIVGPKPNSLDFAGASAFPLTTITAWEIIFESLGLNKGGGKGESILVIAAAGGVG